MKITSHWIWVMSTTTWLLPPPHIVIGTTKMSYNMSKRRIGGQYYKPLHHGCVKWKEIPT